ncbi:MAG: dihydrolipoamide acetyltransferase family protein [Candidatus Brocadiaceae bacterium]|nr:dihydrolipoamide acetyltransferase family protein [Candidatus Brocadiaceae bacterium]
MAYQFKFPDIGEGIVEGIVVGWKVKEGDRVKTDQDLVDVETEKAIFTLPSPREGVILKIHFKEGDTVPVGQPLVTIGEPGEKVVEAMPVKAVPPTPSPIPAGVSKEVMAGARPPKKVLATPAIRKLARELKVDLSRIESTGKGGRITETDVRTFAKAVSAPGGPGVLKAEEKEAPVVKEVKKYDMYGYVTRIPLKGVKKVTAKRIRTALDNAAHVTHHDEADVTHLVEIRERHKEYATKRGVKLTYIPFVIKAVIEGLKDHPYLNATLEDEEIVLKKYFNIGVAVDTPDGIIVPVVKGADQKTILELAREIEALARKALERKIDLADLQGGSFTITNIGMIGGTYFTPIINYPEAAILGLGRITERPVVKNGNINIGKILPLSLSYDHRVVDGADAARFMNTVKEHLEDPDLFLVELGRQTEH